MDVKQAEKAWSDRHEKRCLDFLRELKELENKHKCYVDVGIDGHYGITYEDPFTPDDHYEICFDIVRKVYPNCYKDRYLKGIKNESNNCSKTTGKTSELEFQPY